MVLQPTKISLLQIICQSDGGKNFYHDILIVIFEVGKSFKNRDNITISHW